MLSCSFYSHNKTVFNAQHSKSQSAWIQFNNMHFFDWKLFGKSTKCSLFKASWGHFTWDNVSNRKNSHYMLGLSLHSMYWITAYSRGKYSTQYRHMRETFIYKTWRDTTIVLLNTSVPFLYSFNHTLCVFVCVCVNDKLVFEQKQAVPCA